MEIYAKIGLVTRAHRFQPKWQQLPGIFNCPIVFLGEFPVTQRAYLEFETGAMTKEASRVMPRLKLQDVWKMMFFFG